MNALTREEVEALRSTTPGVDRVVHLNHAGAALPDARVLGIQIDHLRREGEIGGYEAAAEAADRESAVYDSIARLIGADRNEIARLEHATAAWNAGFWSIPMRTGQRVLTAEAAYGANAVGFMRARDRHGVTIEVVPSDASGQVDVAELERRIDDDVALVALTHIPTNGGLVNPAAEVGGITRRFGVPFLLDACQSIGHLDLDVETIGCDLLSATGRKYLRGPRGSGFLYASDRIVDRLMPDHPDHWGADWDRTDGYTLHSGARRFEWWEYNHAAWLGLGAAADHALDIGMQRIEATIADRSTDLRDALLDAGLPVFDLGERRSGIVTTIAGERDPFTVQSELGSKGINVSVTTRDSTRWDFERRDLPPMLRVSVHYITTVDELARAVRTLSELR